VERSKFLKLRNFDMAVKMTNFQFSTKACSLKSFQNILKIARIAPLYFYTMQNWNKDKRACINVTISTLRHGPWIARSS